eukprot:TRINITY_DN15398_c0_g1_i2.p1 TRINITY_DN15398_c0_g1~~TRINITY_DN15398_c0_g1_i2.p1  ORF type:complete len:117 (-),score=11.46 TRINITY_DN15398_c0_g1_i2:107-457(-)
MQISVRFAAEHFVPRLATRSPALPSWRKSKASCQCALPNIRQYLPGLQKYRSDSRLKSFGSPSYHQAFSAIVKCRPASPTGEFYCWAFHIVNSCKTCRANDACSWQLLTYPLERWK